MFDLAHDVKSKTDSVVIWDFDTVPSGNCGETLVQMSPGAPCISDCVSIEKIFEEYAEQARENYFEVLADLNEMHFASDLSAYFVLPISKVPVWWMSPITRQLNFLSVNSVDRFLSFSALGLWLCDQKVKKIKIASDDNALNEFFVGWCNHHGVVLNAFKGETPYSWKPDLRVFTVTMCFMKAVFWLLKRYVLALWIRTFRRPNPIDLSPPVVFFGYTDNLDLKAAIKGRFSSSYWGKLPSELSRLGVSTLWFHRFVKDRGLRSPRRAAALLSRISQKRQNNATHIVLESCLSTECFIQIFWSWLRLRTRRTQFFSTLAAHKPSHYLFVKELWNYWNGFGLLSSIYEDRLLTNAIKMMPEKCTTVALQENHPWEMILYHSLKDKADNRSIGFFHSTLRYWDLRYFPASHYLSKCRQTKYLSPAPDCSVVGSRVDASILAKHSQNEQQAVVAEKLRMSTAFDLDSPDKVGVPHNDGKVRVLFIGEYDPIATLRVFYLTLEALDKAEREFEVYVKPHPNCSIDFVSINKIEIQVTDMPVKELVLYCDIICGADISSAFVEVAPLQIPCICVLTKLYCMSPMVAHESFEFVRDLKGFSNAIERSYAQIKNLEQKLKAAAEYDTSLIDQKLTSWMKVLGVK